jgi:hypothetical protein
MKLYYLQIKSKNEKSLQNFLIFFFKSLTVEFGIYAQITLNKTKNQKIVLLKSPHVNKNAGEFFIIDLLFKTLSLNFFHSKKNIIMLKKTLDILFQDISIILKIISSKDLQIKNNKTLFYLDNFKIFKTVKKTSNKKRNLKKFDLQKHYLNKTYFASLLGFLNIISICGEIIIL